MLEKKITEEDFDDMMNTMGKRCVAHMFKAAILTMVLVGLVVVTDSADTIV